MSPSASTATRHVLPGLRQEPLASYLAGLGLFRLIGEQADPDATAAWSAGGLVISTTVEDMAAWLVDEYVPTSVLSPWNNGSGFGSKDAKPKETLEALKRHPSTRLGDLREAIKVAHDVHERSLASGWITEDGKIRDKGRIVREFRNRCPDKLLPWIDATVVLTGEDPLYPPLLGTGGNDGRLDFSTNFHQRLLEVLDPVGEARERSLILARDLLAGAETERLAQAAVGQFDPAAAGGPGSSRFGAADSLVNPWGFLLLVEGALLFASSTVRRHQHDARRAAVPFTVRSSPDGSASGAYGEQSSSRGEVWTPVWTREFSLPEVRQLFAEARASWRGRPARQAVDFYAATRTLGVTRGVDRFVRYGLYQRNGLAFVAVPVDVVDVRDRPAVRLAAELDDWVSRLRGSDTSAAIGQSLRRFDSAYLEFARDGEPVRLAQLLAALTRLEQAVGRSGRTRERVPVRHRLPDARPFLALLAEAECAELRVAVGLASCTTRPGTDSDRSPARTMRQILLPIDPNSSGRDWTKDWRDTPVVPGLGVRSLLEVLADVLVWRSRTASDESGRQVPGRGESPGGGPAFRGVPGFPAGLSVPAADLHALAGGRLDPAVLELWLNACLALNWYKVTTWPWKREVPLVPEPTLGMLSPFAAGLRQQKDEGDVPALALRPDWAMRLTAGQAPAVHAEAVARLHQAGWEAAPLPAVPPTSRSGEAGVRIAAALLPRCPEAIAVLKLLATKPKKLSESIELTESEYPHQIEELQ
jgi:CRISPR-associated protein Csx17